VKIFEHEEPVLFRTVVAKLAKQGIQLWKFDHELRDKATGHCEKLWYFSSAQDGSQRWAEVYPCGDEERLEPTEVRSICARLGVDPATFGWVILDKPVRAIPVQR